MSETPQNEQPMPEVSATPTDVLDPMADAPVLPPDSELADAIALRSTGLQPAHGDPLLFQSWMQPEIERQVRSPHLGHLGLLGVLAIFGLCCAGLLTRLALHFHLFGVATLKQAITDIHYTLGSMVILYLVTFSAGMLIFPLFWQKNFFAGLHWRAMTALRLRKQLIVAAFLCVVLAMLSGILMPGPENTPIDKLFRTPTAAWTMFAFGVTMAPFFEEIVFRGFLLPALCTGWDWAVERSTGRLPRPLDENGHPQWSVFAMVIGAVFTSVPFALLHAEQTGSAAGPLLLLFCVSLVLCWARLITRSLAASVLVHACYNFMLFSFMLIGTGGFRHMDKM